MNCRKCGAKQITRRSAGIFSCRHCGVQPGPFHLCRAGLPTRAIAIATEVELLPADFSYEIAPRQPRLLAGSAAIGDKL